MGLFDAFRAFGAALRKGPMIPAHVGQQINVVDTTKPPTMADVPLDWSSAWMGPGSAFTINQSTRDRDKETEPRTFQYNPNVNATISPRLAYGLMPFSTLRSYAETVPEVSQSINIITEELKAFTPSLVDEDDNVLDFPDLAWMTERPDGYYPWPVWMSRFMYNVLAYDAGCAYLVHDGSRIVAARVIDGSTVFPLVDERGEQPAPPAPAFTQVLYGTPYQFYNTRQLYYRPRHLRVDSPYGRTPIEDALAAVMLLQNLWDYEAKKYTEGNIPEALFRAPAGWSVDQVLEAERAWNSRMVGSNTERVRGRFIPNGFEFVLAKDLTFNVDSHSVAANAVRLAFGIPQSEVGEAPGGGLGGSGYAEAMQSAFYRMALAPNIVYIESLFDYILRENGYPEIHFKMQFPSESINPQQEEDKQVARFVGGIATRDETRQALQMQPIGGEDGAYLIDPKPAAAPGDSSFGAAPQAMATEAPQPMSRPIQVAKRAPLAKMLGLTDEDDAYFGAPIAAPLDVEMPAQGANTSQIVSIGKPPISAVWKPTSGEVDALLEKAGGPLHLREEAVFLLDRALARDNAHYLVPVTYTAEHNGEPGSVQVYITHSADAIENYSPLFAEAAAILDYVSCQLDRHGHNWLTHPDDPDRPILIDNGLSFPVENKPVVSHFVTQCAGLDIGGEGMDSLYHLIGNGEFWRDLEDVLGDASAVDGARARAKELHEFGKFPAAEVDIA